MSTFIRTIGRCAYNGYSFDIYNNKDGSATIRPVRHSHDLPKSHWIGFKSLAALEIFIDDYSEDKDLCGVDLVRSLIAKYI